MKTTKFLIASALVFALAAPAIAQTATPGVDKRQAEQQKRIDQGVKSGELNKGEAKRLEKGQERVQKMEDKAKADGNVTDKEKAKIKHAQDVESKKIKKEKNDKQKAK